MNQSSCMREFHDPVRSICADAGTAASISTDSTASTQDLEGILHGELHDARVAARRQNFSKGADVVIGCRVSPVEVVEKVEGLDAELEILRRGQRDQPRQRQVDRPEAGTLNAVD